MPSHLFTENDQIKVDLQPPAGATAVIIRATVKRGPEPPPATGLRLFHLRNVPSADGGRGNNDPRPRATELLEIVYRNGVGILSWHGFGPKQEGHRAPDKTGKLPESFPVTVALPLQAGGGAAVAIGDWSFEGATEVHPGAHMELVLGFAGPGDLKAPAGWTAEWADNAVEWVGATAPVNPPSTPPVPPSPPIVTPPTPPAPPAGFDWKAELRHDLQQLATKYAAAQGVDPTLLLGLQLLLGMVKR